MQATSISSINNLPISEKRELFIRLIPPALLERFNLSPFMVDKNGQELLTITGKPESQSLELAMYHQYQFPDPILYCHLADNLNGKIHVLLYIMNDPESPRFNVDRMPDGTPTKFGTKTRNLEAEMAAMQAGLFPGQVRRGLRMLSDAVATFDNFVDSLGHTMYFNEPLFYHNAIIFERYGFNYQSGRKRMEKIHRDFQNDQELIDRLDGSPFRQPEAANSIFFRSWAIHDGILGHPFENVTMYKVIGKKSQVDTAPGINWM